MPGGVEPGVQHRRRSAVSRSTSSRGAWRRRWARAGRRAPATRGTKWCTRTRTTDSFARVFGAAAADAARRGAARDGGVGAGARRPRERRRSTASRSRRTCRRHGATLSEARPATLSRRAPDGGSGARAGLGGDRRASAPAGCRQARTCWRSARATATGSMRVRAARRVAVDIWPDMPRHAAPGVEPLVMDAATELRTLGAGSFDVVLASNVLEHFEPDAASRRSSPTSVGAAAARRPADHRAAELPVRVSAATSTTTRTARSSRTCRWPTLLRAHGFRIERVRAAVPAVFDARIARCRCTRWAGPRVPALAVQAARGPDAGGRRQGLTNEAHARNQDRQRRASRL